MVHDMTFMPGWVIIYHVYKKQRVIQLNLFIFQKLPIKWQPTLLFVLMTHVKYIKHCRIPIFNELIYWLQKQLLKLYFVFILKP